GYDKEVEMIRIDHEMGLFTAPYVFTPEQAIAIVEAGADLRVAHVGLTTAGSIGAAVALTLDEAVDRVLAIAAAGRHARGGIIVLCHGGPFDEPDAVAQGLARLPGVAGFFGASSIERLPTERAIRSQVEHFKGLKLNPESPFASGGGQGEGHPTR